MKQNVKQSLCNALAWLALFGACALAFGVLYGALWLGYILGFKM